MDDLEDRMRKLERIVAQLGQKVLDQDAEIDRLKSELSMVHTERAIASLTPWPVQVIAAARR
jgi:hypothetical protein